MLLFLKDRTGWEIRRRKQRGRGVVGRTLVAAREREDNAGTRIWEALFPLFSHIFATCPKKMLF